VLIGHGIDKGRPTRVLPGLNDAIRHRLCNVTTRFFQTDIATYENFRGSVAIMARLQTTSLDDQTRVDTVDAL
jgi:hypothetical protein